MELSVVVCTRNRARVLGDAIDSLGRQTMDPRRYEVVVVDNGSTDDTAEVLARRQAANLRVVHESRLGLSRARNAGVAAARAEIVAFLDDDAVADERWLAAISASFGRHGPGAVTGRVEALWEVPRPAWLGDGLLPYLSLVDWGPVGGVVGRGQWICGTNMAFRRRMLLDAGGFPEDLGRVGDKLLSMEEVVVQRRLEARGVQVWYDPALVVRHRVPASRLTPAWFEERAFWQGVSNARADRHCVGLGAPRPWGYFLAFAALVLAAPWRLAGRGKVSGLEARCTALMRAGYVLGWGGVLS